MDSFTYLFTPGSFFSLHLGFTKLSLPSVLRCSRLHECAFRLNYPVCYIWLLNGFLCHQLCEFDQYYILLDNHTFLNKCIVSLINYVNNLWLVLPLSLCAKWSPVICHPIKMSFCCSLAQQQQQQKNQIHLWSWTLVKMDWPQNWLKLPSLTSCSSGMNSALRSRLNWSWICKGLTFRRSMASLRRLWPTPATAKMRRWTPEWSRCPGRCWGVWRGTERLWSRGSWQVSNELLLFSPSVLKSYRLLLQIFIILWENTLFAWICQILFFIL